LKAFGGLQHHSEMLLSSISRAASGKLAPSMRSRFSTAIGQADEYSKGVKIMHWVAGAGILSTIFFVKAAQNTKGKQKGDMMFWHKSVGLLMLGVMPVRVAARLAAKSPPPVPGNAFEIMAAKISHGVLYGMMLFMPVSGAAMGYYGGKGLPFFYTTLPGASEKNGAIAGNAFKFHKLVGEAMTYLVPIHIGATGFHLVKGQNILKRINPFA